MAKMMRCPSCGQEYPLSAKLSGKKVRCKKCQQVFQVPVLPTPAVVATAAPVEPSNILGASPLGSGLGNFLDEELLAGEATAGNDPFAAGTMLPPLPKLNPLPKPKQQGGTRETLGRGFLGTHKLMLTVLPVAAFVLIACSSSGFVMLGLIGGAVGLGIAAFGLLPSPAPNTSPAGKWFALVAMAYVVFNDVQIYLAIPPIPPEKSAIYYGIILGLIIGFAISAAIITAIAIAMRRFGFFRPAAWLYIIWSFIIVGILMFTTIATSSDTTNLKKQTSPNNSAARQGPVFHAPPTLPLDMPSDITPGFKPTNTDADQDAARPKNNDFSRPNFPEVPRGFGGPNRHVPSRPRTPEDHRKWVEEQRKKMEEQSKKWEEENKKRREEMEERMKKRLGPGGMPGFGPDFGPGSGSGPGFGPGN